VVKKEKKRREHGDTQIKKRFVVLKKIICRSVYQCKSMANSGVLGWALKKMNLCALRGKKIWG
jgi:hypothetical protein